MTEKSIPVKRPSCVIKASGEWLVIISTFSSSASSTSHLEALKNDRGFLPITLTDLAPSRREVLQQSIAVFPTPIIRTLSPIDLVCSKATSSSQLIPIWI